MDKKTAKDKLKELRDSLSTILDGKEYQSAKEIKEQSKEALEQAQDASKQFKKSLLERVKDFPIVDKVSQLGTAGTVAVSSAAVVQTDLAVNQTQVFIAEVANDVVEERIEAPFFIDTFVDFYELNDWGQVVIAERVQEAQAFVEDIEVKVNPSPQQTPSNDQTPDSKDSKPSNASSSSSSDSDGEKQADSKEQKSGEKESKAEEKSSSDKKVEEKSEEVKKEAQETQEEPNKESETKETQEQQNAPEGKSEAEVDDLPIIETPFDYQDDIKPHRQVSPTN
jgi:hypothetical protein